MVTFLHTADLHIGKSRDFPDYLGRQALMLDGIYKVAKEQTSGLVLISGDIYDNPVVRPREKDLFINRLSEADRDGIMTVIINGNHDIIDQKDNGYTHLRTVKSLVESRRLRNTVCVEFEPAALYIEKFKIGILAVPALYRKTKEVNGIVSALLQQFRDLHGPDIPVVAMVHETIVGSADESGRPFTRGAALDRNIPVTYWALGDIHVAQAIPGLANAYYSGCPIQHDFSDSGRRGVLVVNTDDPQNPDFVPLYQTVPRLETITIAPDQDTSKVEFPLNSIVRVEATKQQMAEMYLPANVLRKSVLVPSQPAGGLRAVGLSDALDGLVDILVEEGMDQEGQDFSVDFVRSIQ